MTKNKVQKTIKTPLFTKIYATFAALVLAASTLFWSLEGARLQDSNADQSSNVLLFRHLSTLKEALMPSQHSYLLKWPIFYLIKLFGYSSTVFNVFTVAIVMLTVGLLALVIYNIERRLLVFGTICLALASVLLLIPAQPYAGALLPVNMAMITTRNIEYILYILALVLFVSKPRMKSWQFGTAIGLLSLLIASDKLFMILTLGGAAIALLCYSIAKAWNLVSLSVNWLVGSFVAVIISSGILWLINQSGLTHIASQSTGSYGLIHNLHGLGLGIIYGLLGIATNFGANPAYDDRIAKSIPHMFFSHLFSVAGPAYIVNFAVLIAGVAVCIYMLNKSFYGVKHSVSKARDLTAVLIWSTVAAIGAFILTNHYYAVDARYLTIVLFTVFIAIATYVRTKQLQPQKLVIVGSICCVGIIFGIFGSRANYNSQVAALNTLNDRNQLIEEVLKQHPNSYLVGDYWRVMPIELMSAGQAKISPLGDCTHPRGLLSSDAWQPNFHHQAFIYLLTLKGSLTDYPNCSLNEVIKAYGRPNASTLVSGSIEDPSELLLFYDNGINNSAPKTPQPARGPATVLPISTSELPYTTCTAPTIMNFIAHEDDDLLFMNPATYKDIQAGHCVRTIYITAGDAGHDFTYWGFRQRGAEAAYSKMVGTTDIWIERLIKLANNEFITVANPRGNSRISLIFMHLPDGNLRGEGFRATHFESLAKLEAGKISVLNSVDGQSTYDSSQLVNGLNSLMEIYQPAEIRTQAPRNLSNKYSDHSDHIAVGQIVKKSYLVYEKQHFENTITIPIKYYIGYPIRDMPLNVSGGDLNHKQDIWFAYSSFDGFVCRSLAECQKTPTYDAYLQRQYFVSN